ncbi:hypothetical protein G4B88_025653, partial [Cannabis sativa]
GLDSLQEWSFIEGGVFPSLKKLYFDRCRRLKVSLFPDHFPLLRKLVIRGCEQLLPNLLAGSAAHTPFPNLEKLKMMSRFHRLIYCGVFALAHESPMRDFSWKSDNLV